MTSTSEGTGSAAVRGARLAAVQTGLMCAAVEERFRRVLSFHSRIGEAEAMAAGVPAIAARLAEDDPGAFPPAERVWCAGERAAGVLRFIEERDPAALAQFARLRVIDPEGVYWRRGIEAATRRRRETGQSELRVEAIDPWRCPLGWDIAWQRCFRLAHARIKAGGTLPAAAGEVIVLGEDLGAWAAAQRHGWDKLLPAQQWLLQSTLGLESAGEDERPARRSQSAAWERNIAAARQFHAARAI
ncbi:hypothetical protein AB0K74_42770 [Streptomyces sp. NPDC056159]|uniref:hypothetical protein n=1 Tax=Streptomyces sp. NPDC056159 TaxID=3155537 RepID=UPI003417B1D7